MGVDSAAVCVCDRDATSPPRLLALDLEFSMEVVGG